MEDRIPICQKKSRNYSKFDPKSLTVQNLTPKHVVCPELEDTPGDT